MLYIFVIVDAFTKFVWLYPTKSTETAEVLDRLKKQSAIFGNPRRIISDRGTAFTSHAFKDYCKEEGIHHILITIGIPRGNGQVERINRTLIPVLTKLSAPKPEEWHRYVETAQKYLNSIPSRAKDKSPFNLLIGTSMRLKEDPAIRELLQAGLVEMFEDQRNELRRQARERLIQIQAANRKSYNRKRIAARQYQEGELVAIQRTQFGAGLKMHPKFLGPYAVARKLRKDRNVLEKVREHEGPQKTSASADNMKPWANDEDEISASEDDNI